MCCVNQCAHARLHPGSTVHVTPRPPAKLQPQPRRQYQIPDKGCERPLHWCRCLLTSSLRSPAPSAGFNHMGSDVDVDAPAQVFKWG